MKRFILAIKIIKDTFKEVLEMSETVQGVEVKNISINYATCITNGWKTFDTCPKAIKLEVAIVLIDFGCSEKISGTDISTGKTWLELAEEKIEAAKQ